LVGKMAFSRSDVANSNSTRWPMGSVIVRLREIKFFATASEIDVAACRCLAISRAGNFLRPTVALRG
jgi:hypothetical protein